MPYVTVKCQSCGGDVELDDSLKWGTCEYCGSKIVFIPDSNDANGTKTVQETKPQKSVEELLGLARKAFNDKKYASVLTYVDEAIEQERKNPEAWELKGKAWGWLSTPQKPYIKEMIDAFTIVLGEQTKDVFVYVDRLRDEVEKICYYVIDKAIAAYNTGASTQSAEIMISLYDGIIESLTKFGKASNVGGKAVEVRNRVKEYVKVNYITSATDAFTSVKDYFDLSKDERTSDRMEKTVTIAYGAMALLENCISIAEGDVEEQFNLYSSLIDMTKTTRRICSFKKGRRSGARNEEYMIDHRISDEMDKVLKSNIVKYEGKMNDLRYDRAKARNKSISAYREQHGEEYERLVYAYEEIKSELDVIAAMPGFLVGDKAKKKKELKQDAEARLAEVEKQMEPFGGVKPL